MHDGSHQMPAWSLERPRRLRPRLGRRIAWLAWPAWLAYTLLFGLALVDKPKQLDCAKAASTAPSGIAVLVCQREYEETREPITGIRLANALRKSNDRLAAKALANNLLETRARSDAFQILGKIATTENRFEDAMTLLETAQQMHRAERRPADVARDDQAIGAVHVKRYRYGEALLVFDACITGAHANDDEVDEYYCHLSAANVLSRVGYFKLAQQELDRAKSLTRSERDLAELEFRQGNLDQEIVRAPLHTGNNEQAILAFGRALEHNERAQISGFALSIELNLAYSFAERGRIDEAEIHLARATALDVQHEKEAERTQAAARIAYRRGDLPLAYSLNEQVYPTISDDEDDSDGDRMVIATMQTRIALASNDLASAEKWARRGVMHAERIRSQQSAVELRPWVLSTRREPYELLFAVLARAGHIEDAMMILDTWQGRTMVDAMASPSPRTSIDLRGAARQIEKLGTWLPIASRAPFAKNPDRSVVLDTLRTIDLLALVVADRDVWCLTANHGQLHLRNLGSLSALQDRLDRFTSTPTADRALASGLGELILQDGMFRSTQDALHVMIDGLLPALPVVALRRQDRPLIAVRPVVRVLRLPETPCATAKQPAHATVLADAAGDLPDARREAEQVSALLHTTSGVGAGATAEALFAVTNDTVLHFAVHAEIDTGGGVLKLYDREVSALEISARKIGPSLVVQSACGSAQSNDAELAGSLAAAFLAAGSTQVVATLRPVSDTGALELAAPFYRAGGVADPVRALAKIQAELADTDNEDWPNFAVFGHDVCSPRL